MISKQDGSPETIRQNVRVGKAYKIFTKDGRKTFVKVDSIREDRLFGNNRVYNKSSFLLEKHYTIYFADVESIRYQKFSIGKTVAAILIPMGIYVAVGTMAGPMVLSGL